MDILFVCTGNICRSPMAEGLLKHMLLQQGLNRRHNVDSAGTHALVNNSPDSMACAVMLEHGIDISKLRSRQLSREDIFRYDLVLLADHYNKGYLQNILHVEDKKSVQMFMDYYPRHVSKNLPDPYGSDKEQFYEVFDLIRETCSNLVEKLAA